MTPPPCPTCGHIRTSAPDATPNATARLARYGSATRKALTGGRDPRPAFPPDAESEFANRERVWGRFIIDLFFMYEVWDSSPEVREYLPHPADWLSSCIDEFIAAVGDAR